MIKSANVSHVRQSLAFAHPVDAGIIRILDMPLIKRTAESLLDDFVDMKYGYQQSTGVPLSEYANKALFDVVHGCAESLKISMPRVTVSGEFGINAATYGTDNACYVVIGSLLNRLFPIDEQAFVIGHECGHIALGHMLYHTVLGYIAAMGTSLPMVGPIIAQTAGLPLAHWSRCSEITADRAGLICCKDPSAAKRALYHIAAGASDISGTDEQVVDSYVESAKAFLADNNIGKYQEFLLPHPHISKRIEALDLFSRSEKYYRVTGLHVPSGTKLLSDEELEQRTTEIFKIK